MRSLFIFILCMAMGLLITTSVMAANGTIAGTVSDETGERLPFAQVLIDGTTLGDAADRNGAYTIANVPPGSYTLEARFIGFRTVSAEIIVAADGTVTQDFTLGTDILYMDSIVVTGTPGGAGISKRDASFAVTTIEAADIVQFSPSSTASLLELVPGVWSESSGGIAGANIDVARTSGRWRCAVRDDVHQWRTALWHGNAIILRAELDLPDRRNGRIGRGASRRAELRLLER